MWLQARVLCFAAQFTANDRAPAGRDMTEALGLHMCGWAKDNRRCSWNSQTGYKIASRMQRTWKEPSGLHNELLASRPVRWPLGAPHGGSVGRWVGAPFPEVLRLRKPACVAAGHSASPGSWLSLALVGLDPGSMAFHRVWWGQRRPRAALHQMCLGAWDGKETRQRA